MGWTWRRVKYVGHVQGMEWLTNGEMLTEAGQKGKITNWQDNRTAGQQNSLGGEMAGK